MALSRRTFIALAIVAVWGLATFLPSQSFSQIPELGLYFDAAGTTAGINAPAFTTFEVYVLADLPPGHPGLTNYEFSVNVPAHVFLLELTLPAGAINSGTIFQPRVDTQGCLGAGGGRVELARYLAVPTTADVAELCLGAIDTPSVTPPTPAFSPCGSATFAAFAAAYDGCAHLNGPACFPPGIFLFQLDFPEVASTNEEFLDLVVDAGFGFCEPCSCPFCSKRRDHCPLIELARELEFTVLWDDEVAELVSVNAEAAASTMSLTSTIGTNSALIRMEGEAPLPSGDVSWLRLRYRMLQPEGMTTITAASPRTAVIGDSERTISAALSIAPGSIIVGPVATQKISLGMLKSRYR